jgi:hypothetical protein
MLISIRSGFLAVLTRLLFSLEDEEFGIQCEQFRQGLFELSAEVHPLANGINPRLGNMLDPFLALDHKSKRPEGVTRAVGTMTGRLTATAVSQGEGTGKAVGRELETGEKLTFALPKTLGGRAGR